MLQINLDDTINVNSTIAIEICTYNGNFLEYRNSI